MAINEGSHEPLAASNCLLLDEIEKTLFNIAGSLQSGTFAMSIFV